MSSNNILHTPVYKRALNLCLVSREIVSCVTVNKNLLPLYESNSLRDVIADSLLTDVVLITRKIAEAQISESISVRRRNFLLITIMLRNINSYCIGLEKDGVRETDYLNLLKSEIRSFKCFFKQWKVSLV